MLSCHLFSPALLILLNLASFRTLELCPSGCYCDSNDTARCCLFPSNVVTPAQCSLPGGRQVSADPDPNLRWPATEACSAKWTNLSVMLLPGSWPPATPKRPCMGLLHRLSIAGGTMTNLNSRDLRLTFNLQNARLEVLIIEHTMLETLEPGLFDRLALRNLVDIQLRHNYRLGNTGLGVALFSNLPQLLALNLESNRLERVEFVRWGFPTIKKGVSPNHLTTLNLANNSLTFISPGAFSLFPFLEILSLANNKLSILSSEAFEGLTSLKRLDLSGNILNLLGLKNELPGFSISLANLNYLDISMNPLMRGVYDASAAWWLSFGCPASLSHLAINHVDVDLDQGLPILPTIDWGRCPKLERVEIQQTPRLPCLSPAWLRSNVLPPRPELVTSASSVCTPPLATTTAPTLAPMNISAPMVLSSVNPVLSGHLSFRELVISLVAITILFVLGILLIVIIFVCYRKRSSYGSFNKTNEGLTPELKGGVISTYRPAFDCMIPPPIDGNTSDVHGTSLYQPEPQILYDKDGVPVFGLVTPETSPAAAVVLGDSPIAYMLSGRGTPSSNLTLLDKNIQGSDIYKQRIMVPLMMSHTSLAASQVDYPYQHPRMPSYHQNAKSQNPQLHSQNSAISSLFKSASFLSLGGSVHSARPQPPSHLRTFAASPPSVASMDQTRNSLPQSSSLGSSTEQPSLVQGAGYAITESTSATDPSPPS